MVIVKGREPARILTAIGKDDRWRLQYAQRWVDQYNFYLHDADRALALFASRMIFRH
jgi:hypothetical protein